MRKRFNLRSNSNYTPFLAKYNDNKISKNSQNLANRAFQTMPKNMATTWPSLVPEMPSRETQTRRIEPMDIDHFRDQKCFNCSGLGHRARNCPSKIDHNRLPGDPCFAICLTEIGSLRTQREAQDERPPLSQHL